MEHGSTLLQLFQQRLEYLQKLEELLKLQQKALIDSDQEGITQYAEKQVDCLENIQKVHQAWRESFTRIKAELNLSSATSEQLLEMILTPTERKKWEQMVGEYKVVAQRIEELKQNNTLLIHNALSLVRSTLQQLQGQPAGLAVYHPYRKPEQGHILVNKKM